MKIGTIELFFDESGRVSFGIDSSGARVYPYTYKSTLQAWTNRAGWYKPGSLRKALREGRAAWF